MILPTSIPSPAPEWQVFNLGQWLRDIGLTWFGFDINIYAYALCILLGIVAAVMLTNHRLTRRGAEPWITLDIALFAVPLGIIGGRVYHVLTHPDDYFFPGADLLRTLYIWEGGMAIFGALIGGAIGVAIGCRVTGIRFWSFADALAPGLLLAQAFGRLGNWFNQELFGLPTDLPWGLEIDPGNSAIPGRPARGHPVPPHLPLRDHLEPRGRRAPAPAGCPAQGAVGNAPRRLPDLVRRRPQRLRVDPHRPQRALPRHPRQRLGRLGRRRGGDRAHHRAAPPAHGRRAGAVLRRSPVAGGRWGRLGGRLHRDGRRRQ